MTPKIFLSLLVIVILSAGCSARLAEANATPSAPVVITATSPSASASLPTETPPAPPPRPTIAPIEGTSSTPINVRAEPSTASNVLGIIAASTKVQIVGKDPGGNWLQILYPQAADGKGWVTAQYVITATGIEIPVIGGSSNSGSGNVAIAQQQINVRSGPGTSFNSLGTLNAQDVVNLTGKDSNGTWLQIEFPQGSGPDGKGWVNAAFVRATGIENLPIITGAGEVIGTGTPSAIPPTPTPTLIPAWEDGDSQDSPIASVIFEAFGTQSLIYGGDVSAPTGDLQDWVRFTPYTNTVFASLECLGGNLQVNLSENGQPSTLRLGCSDELKKIDVKPGSAYLIQLQIPHSAEGLQYVQYTIKIQTGP